MTFLEMMNNAALESGFAELPQLIGSQSTEAKQWVAVGAREARDLMKWTWPQMKKEHLILLTSATEYPLPSDMQFPISDTFWSISQNRKIDLPTTDEYWSYLQSHSGSTGIRYRARIADDNWEIHNPTPGDTLRVEYVVKGPWLEGSNARERPTKDDNTFILDDELFILGTVWRWKKLKALDWQTDFRDYESYRNAAFFQANGAQKVAGIYDEAKPPYEPFIDLWADGTI